jgi:hypothetical protein
VHVVRVVACELGERGGELLMMIPGRCQSPGGVVSARSAKLGTGTSSARMEMPWQDTWEQADEETDRGKKRRHSHAEQHIC